MLVCLLKEWHFKVQILKWPSFIFYSGSSWPFKIYISLASLRIDLSASGWWTMPFRMHTWNKTKLILSANIKMISNWETFICYKTTLFVTKWYLVHLQPQVPSNERKYTTWLASVDSGKNMLNSLGLLGAWNSFPWGSKKRYFQITSTKRDRF